MIKKLLFLVAVSTVGFLFSQYTTGTVSLPTAGMTIKIDTNATTVTLTLVGDSNSMLGVGFGSSGMTSGDDGFIYNSGANRDFTFVGVGSTPSADASQDWTVTSNTVSGTTRTVVATRSLAGGAGDFAFTNGAGAINIYYARRNANQALGYHGGLRDYATLNKVLGVEDVNPAEIFGIYPNPVQDELTIRNYEKIKSLNIFDFNGRSIEKNIVPKEKIDVSYLESGIYFIEIYDQTGSVSYHKIIKK